MIRGRSSADGSRCVVCRVARDGSWHADGGIEGWRQPARRQLPCLLRKAKHYLARQGTKVGAPERSAAMADETKKLAAFLSSLGVGATAARGYAELLVAEGFDTAAAFESLTAEELRDDFGFKRGHLRMVAAHREEIAASAVLPSNPEPEAALLLEVLSELSLDALADKLAASGLDNESLAHAEAEDFEHFGIPADSGMQLGQRMRQKLGLETVRRCSTFLSRLVQRLTYSQRQTQ